MKSIVKFSKSKLGMYIEGFISYDIIDFLLSLIGLK